MSKLEGLGMMASSQMDRVPCWTPKPGLCMENEGKICPGDPATTTLPPSRSDSCRFCMVTMPFNCLQLLCPVIPGVVGRWEPSLLDSLPRSALTQGTPCAFHLDLHPCKVFQSLRLLESFQGFSSARPPLPSTFGLWYAGPTQVPSRRLLDS